MPRIVSTPKRVLTKGRTPEVDKTLFYEKEIERNRKSVIPENGVGYSKDRVAVDHSIIKAPATSIGVWRVHYGGKLRMKIR